MKISIKTEFFFWVSSLINAFYRCMNFFREKKKKLKNVVQSKTIKP